MIDSLIHKSFTFDGNSFGSEAEWIRFMDQHYPGGSELLRSWFGNGRIEVKTSGSTGTPKTLFFTRAQMRASALATGQFFGMGEDTRALLCLPLEYIAGKMMLVRAMTLGWQLQGVEPSIQLDLNQQDQYDFAAMIPMQLEENLESLGGIENLIVGGAAVNHRLQKKIESLPTKIYATYGMTETITHIAVKPLNRSAREESNGGPRFLAEEVYTGLPGVTFSKDERGCLVINCPRISSNSIVTNDLVDRVTENSFQLKGRIDNIINSGGVKLIPESIEQAYSECLSQRFFAAGLPDAKLGEKMIFVVEGKPDKELLHRLKVFQAASEGRIKRHEIPKDVIFLSKFEETDSGKVNRRKNLKRIVSEDPDPI